MSWFKQSRVKDPAYLRFLATMPCIIMRSNDGTVVSHHIQRSGLRGMGLKSPDNFCLPINSQSHYMLHEVGEAKYFGLNGIGNPIEIANRLYELYQNKEYDAMKTLIITRKIDEQ